MSADGNKATGLDRFPFKFAQVFWPKFRGEIISMFDHFYEVVEFDHRFSSTFISLIQKSRIQLTARLKCVIGKLVWDFQSAFIRSRSIFERW